MNDFVVMLPKHELLAEVLRTRALLGPTAVPGFFEKSARHVIDMLWDVEPRLTATDVLQVLSSVDLLNTVVSEYERRVQDVRLWAEVFRAAPDGRMQEDLHALLLGPQT